MHSDVALSVCCTSVCVRCVSLCARARVLCTIVLVNLARKRAIAVLLWCHASILLLVEIMVALPADGQRVQIQITLGIH